MTFTSQQRENLEKLATYLESLPADYAHFSMLDYLRSFSDDVAMKYALKNGGVHSCGTAACAVGHGPAAGVLVGREYLFNGKVMWNVYSEEFCSRFTNEWSFLFSASWTTCDDHHWGAAARIRYLLAGNEIESLYFSDEPVSLYAPFRKQEQPA